MADYRIDLVIAFFLFTLVSIRADGPCKELFPKILCDYNVELNHDNSAPFCLCADTIDDGVQLGDTVTLTHCPQHLCLMKLLT